MEDAVDILALEKFVKAGKISPQIPAGTLEKLLDDEVYVAHVGAEDQEDRRDRSGRRGYGRRGGRPGHPAGRRRQL